MKENFYQFSALFLLLSALYLGFQYSPLIFRLAVSTSDQKHEYYFKSFSDYTRFSKYVSNVRKQDPLMSYESAIDFSVVNFDFHPHLKEGDSLL